MRNLPATIPAVHVTARSGNAKTGDIPVTYRPMTTCEPTCPFLPSGDIGGCYGTGRIFGMAAKYAATVSVDSVRTKLRKRNPAARFMRDRVVGDVVTESGAIDHAYIRTIAALAREADLIPFGYTHAWRRMTSDDVAEIAATGYVINASCESRDDVRHAVALGMPTVIASDIVDDGETFTRPDGTTLRIVTCPAQSRDDVTCASCGLCTRPERRAVVRFNIHGTARKRATHAVDIAENGADHA